MRKRAWSIFCAAALTMASLAGCGGNGGNEETKGTENPVTETGNEKEEITLRFSWWGSDNRHEATIKAIDRYMELNPGISIEYEYMGFDTYYEKLLTQLSGGTQPDICSIDHKWIGDLINQDKPFLNINELTDIIDLSKFDQEFVQNFCGREDYLIGVPCGMTARGALYNVEFFEKYGLSSEKDWTWEDLLEAGEKVNQQDPDAHLLFLTNDVLVYLTRDLIKQKYGENMINDNYELVCTEEDLKECMEMVKKLVDTGTMPSFEQTVLYENVFADQVPAWLEGKWGMTVLVNSNLPSVVAASPFEVKTLRLFSSEGGKDSAITIAPTMMLGIPKACKHPEEAAKFINWFVNDPEAVEITGDTRGVPANEEAKESLAKKGLISEEVSAMLTQALEVTVSPENTPTLNAEVAEAISEYSHQVGYGQMMPEEAAKGLYEDLTRLLKKIKP